MLEAYRPWNPQGKTLALVNQCIAITEEYMEAGFRLTLRQLYYQLVARDIVPNTERSYKNIGTYCARARLAGLMDWEAIEDRARRPHFFGHFVNLSQCVSWAMNEYRLNRWATQECYAELWVEKDALASVLQPLADEYHVTLMVNRGYSSASAMKESAERFRRQQHRPCHLFYLGDLDPSGEDMVRDIDARLFEFGVEVEVEKIALTIEQVRRYRPPPNPAKMSDSRAAEFVKKYGRSSWEVDALTPQQLQAVIRDSLDGIIDTEAMDEIIEQEEADKARLMVAAQEIAEQDDEEE